MVNPVREHMKILVAFDGSEYSKRAIEQAVDVARKFSGALTVLGAGFLSDRFGIHTSFLLIGFLGALIAVYYLAQRPRFLATDRAA